MHLECWSEPQKEKRLIRDEEREDEDFHLSLGEYDKQEQDKQSGRKQRIVQLKMILQQQMDEIKQKEQEVFFSSIFIYFKKNKSF